MTHTATQFVLIPVADFTSFPSADRNQILNASSSSQLSHVPQKTFDAIDYYLLELDADKAWHTRAVEYRLLSLTQIQEITSLGVYDPES